MEEIVTYFSFYPRQVLVEADWYFFSKAFQEILFGKELGYAIGKAYNLMPANFYSYNCKETDERVFLAVKIEEGYLAVRKISDFEDLGEEILIPIKSGNIIKGFYGNRYVECEL